VRPYWQSSSPRKNVSEPPACGLLPLADGRLEPPLDDVAPQGGGQSHEGEGRAALAPPASFVWPPAGGNSTHFWAGRREAGGSQAPPPANVLSESSGELSPSAADQPQARVVQPSPAKCRPPVATVHPPPVPTLSPGAPGEASAEMLAAGQVNPADHDQPAGPYQLEDHDKPAGHGKPASHDQPVGYVLTAEQDKPAAARGATNCTTHGSLSVGASARREVQRGRRGRRSRRRRRLCWNIWWLSRRPLDTRLVRGLRGCGSWRLPVPPSWLKCRQAGVGRGHSGVAHAEDKHWRAVCAGPSNVWAYNHGYFQQCWDVGHTWRCRFLSRARPQPDGGGRVGRVPVACASKASATFDSKASRQRQEDRQGQGKKKPWGKKKPFSAVPVTSIA